MAKLLVYDLNLQPCDDYQITAVLGNAIEISSEDEEELIVDDDEEVNLDDYAICSNYSQNSNHYLSPTSNETTAAKTTMNLRCRKNIKSLAYLDLRPDTPSDLEDESGTKSIGNSSNDFCQEHSNGSDVDILKIQMKEEEPDDIDVGTNDLGQKNLSRYVDTPFAESFRASNTTSNFGPSKCTADISSYVIFKQKKFKNSPADDSHLSARKRQSHHNFMESVRRHQLKNFFDQVKRLIPSIRHKKICPKIEILTEAKKLCNDLRNEQAVWEKLKNKHEETNLKLRKELRNLICETVF